MIPEIRQKILKKNGHEAVLIKLIVVAKVMGYETSEPIEDIADRLGIPIIKLRKYKVIYKKDLDKLLKGLLNSHNSHNTNDNFETNNNFD